MKLFIRLALFMLTLILVIQCKKDEPPPLVMINDNNFLKALIELGIDTDGDGKINQAEAEVVKSLDISGCDISDISGIEKFKDLEWLNCSDNNISDLEVSQNTFVKNLSFGNNQLTLLNFLIIVLYFN